MLLAAQEPVGKPAGKNHADQYKHIQKIIAFRYRLSHRLKKLQPNAVHQGGHHAGHHKVLQLRLPSERPKTVVHPEKVKNTQRKKDIDWKEPVNRRQKVFRYHIQMKFVTDQHRHITCKYDTDDIVDNQACPAVEQLYVKRFFLFFVLFFFILHH